MIKYLEAERQKSYSIGVYGYRMRRKIVVSHRFNTLDLKLPSI